MEPNTHRALDPRLCGELRALEEGRAVVELTALSEMQADEHALVHGGFVFGLADHAAMLAVNHPNVVLGSADTRFLAPVLVGDVLRAEATRRAVEGKKHLVDVDVWRDAERVFSGVFVCFVPGQHVAVARREAGR